MAGESGQANQNDRGGCRETGGLKEELVTVILKIKSLPPDTVPVPKPSPAAYLASSSALEELLECAKQHGDPQARALAEKVDQERKASASQDAPGAPVPPTRDNRGDNTPVQATGQGTTQRAASPGRGSPATPEQGLVAELRTQEAATLPAVEEKPDEDMDDVNAEQPSPGDSPGIGARRRRFGGRRGAQAH
eukprot:75802-Amphidinium_carterae.1